MDLEKNKKSKSYSSPDDSFFLVFSGHLVWIRVLSVYGLALAGEGKTRLSRHAGVLYSVPGKVTDQTGSPGQYGYDTW